MDFLAFFKHWPKENLDVVKYLWYYQLMIINTRTDNNQGHHNYGTNLVLYLNKLTMSLYIVILLVYPVGEQIVPMAPAVSYI
jgi:hypothetical protein